MPLSVRQVEEEVARRLVAMNTAPGVTAYQQAAHGQDVWHEIPEIGPAETTAQPLAHLGFQVAVTDATSAGSSREGHAQYGRIRSRMQVGFAYQVRPTDQVPDKRLAWDAAHDVARALNVDHDEWTLDIVNFGRPLLGIEKTGASFLLMTLLFDVFHEIEV